MPHRALVSLLLLVSFAVCCARLAKAQAIAAGQDIVRVGSVEQFNDAIRTAGDNRTIVLQAGTYGTLAIDGLNAKGGLQITADRSASRPVVNRIVISNSRGISIDNLVLKPSGGEAQGDYLVSIRQSQDIRLAHSQFEALADQGDKRMRGVFMADVERIQVSDNRIEGLERGVVAAKGKALTVEHNMIQRMTTDGINIVEFDGVSLLGNRFGGFKVDAGNHADFIQFWTRRTSIPSRNIVIRNNVMLQDTADPVQGIFLGNEDNIPYENLTVSHNLIMTGSPHGITVNLARNVLVERNMVIDVLNSIYNGAIRVQKSSDGTVSNNLAVAYALTQNNGIQATRNTNLPRLEKATRQRLAERVAEGLRREGAPFPVHAGHAITAEHRAAGPRPR